MPRYRTTLLLRFGKDSEHRLVMYVEAGDENSAIREIKSATSKEFPHIDLTQPWEIIIEELPPRAMASVEKHGEESQADRRARARLGDLRDRHY
jgi:hypothetical protein